MIFAGGLIILGTLYNICINKHIPYPTQIQEAPHYDFIQQKKPKKTRYIHTYMKVKCILRAKKLFYVIFYNRDD